MSRYELWIAGCLTASAACSLLILYLRRPKEGNIQLPGHIRHIAGSNEPYHENDPFDVTKPEDTIDGYPIGEEAFWARVRFSNPF